MFDSVNDHIKYAKEIGTNLIGRPGPKWTAYALAIEVERLRGALEEIECIPDTITAAHFAREVAAGALHPKDNNT